MKIRNILFLLASALLIIQATACSDSDIDSQFTASMTDREASFDLRIDIDQFSVSSAGSSLSFSVSSTDSWEATSPDSWISFTSSTGSGNGTVSFVVAENTSHSLRSSTITVKGMQSQITRTIQVTQAGVTVIDIEDFGNDDEWY